MNTPETKIAHLSALLGTIEHGEMHVSGVPVSVIADEAKTPYFVYNADTVSKRIGELRDALGPETAIYFSIKANPSLGLCQVMAAHQVGAELASIGELAVAQKAGFPASKTIFAGPGKTHEELEAAVKLGLESVNVESAGELERLSAIATQLKKPVRVCLRINPRAQVKGAQMRMGGGPLQFGIDEENIPEVIQRFKSHAYLKFVGIHVYIGSQIFDIDALVTHCQEVVTLAEDVAHNLGTPLEMIDFGGGFAVPYFENSVDFDLASFGARYRSEVVTRCKQSRLLQNAQLVIELGRYLVAEAGLYVTRVLDVKTSRGTTFVVTDGGMNHHITATGNFGQVFRKAYPVAVLNRMGETCDTPASVVGPCCTPLDVLGQKIALPRVEVGDLIGVYYSGAYGYSASSLNFLSHPTPAEVLVQKGKMHLLRAPGASDAVLRDQMPMK